MNNTKFTIKSDEPTDFNYPDEEESAAAVRACCGRCCTACESPAEYAWRKRNVNLAALLGMAIEEELTQAEKEAVKAVCYELRSLSEIAAEKGISPSAVYGTYERAREKLRRALRYVVIYQRDLVPQTDYPEPLDYAYRILSSGKQKGGSAAERFRYAREQKGISLRMAERATGISKTKILRIERGEVTPDSDETEKLCAVYGLDVCVLRQ